MGGTLERHAQTGIAGVANTGSDKNWTGHDFAQANWYAYGRLAWNPSLTAEGIAEEWIRMTWSNDKDVVEAIRDLMMRSREAFVDYTMPLGLHHLIGGDHYAPMPENTDKRRADWSATYYHRADASGIGFDRTRTGSDAVSQYRSPLREQWSDPATVPENLLLWFHHVPWDRPLRSGRALWDELVAHYAHGAEEVRAFEERWAGLGGKVDAERHQAVLAKLHQQALEAAQWRDKIAFPDTARCAVLTTSPRHRDAEEVRAPFILVIDGQLSVRANPTTARPPVEAAARARRPPARRTAPRTTRPPRPARSRRSWTPPRRAGRPREAHRPVGHPPCSRSVA